MPTKAKAELAAYGASAVALAALPPLAEPAVHAPVTAIGGGCLWWLYRKVTNRADFPTVIATAQRVLPAVTGAGVYAAAAMAPGTAWWEIAVPAAWAAAMGAWLPLTRAGWTLNDGDIEAYPADFSGFVARLWADAPVSGDTRLENVQQLDHDRPDFAADVVAPVGIPVSRMDPVDIAAAFNVPVPAVSLEEIPGVGPGRMRLTVTPTQAPRTKAFEGMWDEFVAAPGGAIPGSTVVRVEHKPAQGQMPARMMILAEVPSGQIARVNHAQLCSAFGVKAAELRLVAETDGGSQAMVTLYESSPLTGTRKATRALVTPDADGYWVLGTAHDGTDAEARLFDEKGALHGYLVGVTGSGKTVAFVLCLAAEANAGAVSWMVSLDPDAQLAAAGHYIDRQGSGRAYAARATRAAVALMTIRGEFNKEVGHDFSPASPYPLLMLNLDEFNGLCDDSDEGQEIAQNTTYISERGRKYGIGIRFGGQTLDLTRIGGNRSLREQTRSGTGIVLRTVSGISDRQATEGMLPEGVTLAQIPTTFGGGLTLADRMNGLTKAHRGKPTSGAGHVLTGGAAPRMMRVLYVHLPKDGTGHNLDEIFPEGGGINTLTDREIEALGDLYSDWNAPGDDDTTNTPAVGGDSGLLLPPLPPSAAPAGPVRTKKQPTVKDMILAAVTRQMTTKEIRSSVDAAAGTVRNKLSELVEEGRLVQVDHGVYAPAGQPPADR
ncbi:hypothetical protein [Streptomyces radiopugnans]|uniref:hypothetical protein n=1 Tax=Streptomyces radiopugnans TaxID=403935 RepID=UPI003F1C3620